MGGREKQALIGLGMLVVGSLLGASAWDGVEFLGMVVGFFGLMFLLHAAFEPK